MDDKEPDIFETLLLEEAERQANPCCANCRWFYTEYGYDLCRQWGEPKANINSQRCSHWQ